MSGQNHIESFTTTLKVFKWENYTREYKQLNEIQNLYWHIVVLDYLDSTYYQLNEDTYDAFARRVYKSFMGIFYRPHEIIVKLEDKLEGFSKLFLIDNELIWRSLKKEIQADFSNQFSLLHERIRRYLEHKLKTQPKSAGLNFSLNDYDNLHKNLEQIVSRVLHEHLHFTRYTSPLHTSEISNFPFSIPTELIRSFHAHSENYFKSRFSSWFTLMFEANLPSDGPFRRPRSENLQEAFEQLIQRYPKFTSLKKGALTEFIHLYSLDLHGTTYNKSSIRAFLRRNGY